jgi:hypothetical protein
MADALDSKSSIRKNVWVQVPPPVLSICRTGFESNPGAFGLLRQTQWLVLPSSARRRHARVCSFAKTAPKLGWRFGPRIDALRRCISVSGGAHFLGVENELNHALGNIDLLRCHSIRSRASLVCRGRIGVICAGQNHFRYGRGQ